MTKLDPMRAAFLRALERASAERSPERIVLPTGVARTDEVRKVVSAIERLNPREVAAMNKTVKRHRRKFESIRRHKRDVEEEDAR